MTNTQRNTTVLSVLLTIVIVSSTLLMHRFGKKIQNYQSENKSLQNSINLFDQQIANLDKLKEQYELQLQLIALQNKILVKQDNPTITYQYLLKLNTWLDLNLIFDFSIVSAENSTSLWNEYIISGNSRFYDVAQLIKAIEYQRLLITLEEVNIAFNQAAVSDSVAYSMIFRTHYHPEGNEFPLISYKKVEPADVDDELFKAKFYEIPPIRSIDPTLLNTDTATLIGMTDTKAFIRDSQGIIRIMSVGDPVAYGYIHSIDSEAAKVTFHLNIYGAEEDKILLLQRK